MKCSYCNNSNDSLMWNGHYYVCKECLFDIKFREKYNK